MSSRLEVSNFSPNNWEAYRESRKNIFLCRRREQYWENLLVADLRVDESFQLDAFDYMIHDEELAAVILTRGLLENKTAGLPSTASETSYPEFRCKISVRLDNSISSYQGEMVTFPTGSASSLFFDFMPQVAEQIDRYLVLLNFERSPLIRTGELIVSEVSLHSNEVKFVDNFEVLSNSVTVIPLNSLKAQIAFDSCLMFNSNIGLIPYFVAHSREDEVLSFEHTHPPSSLVVLGNRFGVQKTIKQSWLGSQSHKITR